MSPRLLSASLSLCTSVCLTVAQPGSSALDSRSPALCSRSCHSRRLTVRACVGLSVPRRVSVPLAMQGPCSRLLCPHRSPAPTQCPGRFLRTAEGVWRGGCTRVLLARSLFLSLCLSRPLPLSLSLFLSLSLSPSASPSQRPALSDSSCLTAPTCPLLCHSVVPPRASQPPSVPLSRAPASPPPPPAPPPVPALPRARLLPAAPAASVPARAAASSPPDSHTRKPAGAGRLRGVRASATGRGRSWQSRRAGTCPVRLARSAIHSPGSSLRQPRGWRQSAGATRGSVSVINQKENWHAVPCPSPPRPRSPPPCPSPPAYLSRGHLRLLRTLAQAQLTPFLRCSLSRPTLQRISHNNNTSPHPNESVASELSEILGFEQHQKSGRAAPSALAAGDCPDRCPPERRFRITAVRQKPGKGRAWGREQS